MFRRPPRLPPRRLRLPNAVRDRALNRRGFLLGALAAIAAPACAQVSVLHRTDGLVVTEEPGGLRTLRFADGSRQSAVKAGDPEHLEMPYSRVALAGLALCGEPRRVLVVGLGGGMLPSFLRRYYPGSTIDAVEIDPAVVDVAKRFFGFREDALMRAHLGDGRRFIEGVREPYDLIVLDAYGAGGVPVHLTTAEFLGAVRRALAPGGVAVGNLWKTAENPSYDSMLRTYEEAFDEVLMLDVEGYVNQIVLALPRKARVSRDELARRARDVSSARRFRFDLGELVESGWARAPRGRPGRPLRDADFQ
jgi:spermidine synthase